MLPWPGGGHGAPRYLREGDPGLAPWGTGQGRQERGRQPGGSAPSSGSSCRGRRPLGPLGSPEGCCGGAAQRPAGLLGAAPGRLQPAAARSRGRPRLPRPWRRLALGQPPARPDTGATSGEPPPGGRAGGSGRCHPAAGSPGAGGGSAGGSGQGPAAPVPPPCPCPAVAAARGPPPARRGLRRGARRRVLLPGARSPLQRRT